jgi:hypothetical protein
VSARAGGRLTLPRLAARVDRLPGLRGWNRRKAQATLAVLDASILGTLATRQSQGFGLLLVACAAFAVLITMEAVHPAIGRRAVLWSSAVLIVAAVVIAPRNSDDVWSYAMYGHMLAHYHANPYTVSPLAYSGDPWFWRVSVWWQDTRTVYGPLFTAASAAGMWVAGNSALAGRLFFQVVTAASVLAALWLLDRRGAEPGALAFLGLSPVIVVDVVNGAHNDALVGCAALAAVVALSAGAGRLRTAAGVLLGIGALIKLIALLPAAAVMLWLWQREERRAAVVLAATVGAITVAGYLAAGGLSALAPLQEASRLVDHWSLWGWLGHAVPVPAIGEGPLGGLAVAPVPKLWLTGPARYGGTAAVVAVVALGIVAWSRDRRPSAGVAAAVLAFVLTTSYIQPWYLAAMLLPLALQWRSRLAALGAGYSVMLLLADAWLNSTGMLKTLLRLPLSTVFPAVQLLALAAFVALAVQALRAPGGRAGGRAPEARLPAGAPAPAG